MATDNKFFVFPIKGKHCGFQVPAVQSMSKATPFNNIAVFPYAPGNTVFAPIGGAYKMMNLYEQKGAGDPNPGDQISDFDCMEIIGIVDGKQIRVTLLGVDFRASKLPTDGEIEQGSAIGMTIPVPNIWPNLGMGISYAPGNVSQDPIVLGNSLGGFVWPENFLNAQATGVNPDLANTPGNESMAKANEGKDGGMGTLLLVGIGIYLAPKILKKLGK